VYEEGFFIIIFAIQRINNKHMKKSGNESGMRTIKSNPTTIPLKPTPRKGLRNCRSLLHKCGKRILVYNEPKKYKKIKKAH